LRSPNVAGPQDASRLLDLCRQSIIFDSLAGVADCLTEIAHDSSVRIVQVPYSSLRPLRYVLPVAAQLPLSPHSISALSKSCPAFRPLISQSTCIADRHSGCGLVAVH
jgi:hypothetical protein